MTTPDPQKREHLKIASRIAKKLLTNGMGVHVKRLALTNDDGKSHGGWCEEAVRDVIADELDRTAARKRRLGPDGQEIGPLYRAKFSDPKFNLRWECGLAAYVEVVNW